MCLSHRVCMLYIRWSVFPFVASPFASRVKEAAYEDLACEESFIFIFMQGPLLYVKGGSRFTLACELIDSHFTTCCSIRFSFYKTR